MVAEGLFGPPAPLFSAVSVFASLLLTPLGHASLDMQVDTMAQILTMARDRHAGMKTFRALVLDSVTLLQGFPPPFFFFFSFLRPLPNTSCSHSQVSKAPWSLFQPNLFPCLEGVLRSFRGRATSLLV